MDLTKCAISPKVLIPRFIFNSEWFSLMKNNAKFSSTSGERLLVSNDANFEMNVGKRWIRFTWSLASIIYKILILYCYLSF